MSSPAFAPAPLLAATAVVSRLRGCRPSPRRTPLRRAAFSSSAPVVVRSFAGVAPTPPSADPRVTTTTTTTTMATSTTDAPPATGVMYVKAGPDGSSVGDCPFSLKVLLAAALKGLDVDVVPVDLSNKPESFLALTEAGSTPVLVHGGRTLTDSGDILAYVDTLGTGPDVCSLFPPAATADASVGEAVGGVFGAFARLLKNKEEAREAELAAGLEAALATVNGVLEAGGGPFLCGPWISAWDCDLIPKLLHVRVAAGHYKGFRLEGHGWGALERYVDVVGRMQAVRSVLCADDVVVWGWSKFF